ncbi:DNA-directed RNA polymerases IV and V subunit 4, partial [Mucuna pruriens]
MCHTELNSKSEKTYTPLVVELHWCVVLGTYHSNSFSSSSALSPVSLSLLWEKRVSAMSEKGGKGASLLSKGGSLKGKDDSATKSAKGRRVQFSKEGPFESGISSSLTSLKSGGKGGKGDKVANGGKSSQSKELHSSEHRVDQQLPENIKCLMDCEAADVLQGIQEQMVMLSRDSSIKIPISFEKGLQYAKSSIKYTNLQSIRRILEPLAVCGLTESEICVIGNVCPETVDEVFSLLPSLKFDFDPSLSPSKIEILQLLSGYYIQSYIGDQYYDRRSIDRQVLKDSLSELAKLRQPIHILLGCTEFNACDHVIKDIVQYSTSASNEPMNFD